MNSRPETDVLIVGAGPTGLVLALWLARLGVRVRILDKTAEAATTSRALAVQGRTLEFYSQLGISDAVVTRGARLDALNFWVTGKNIARAAFGGAGASLSPFPYALIFPQAEHERLLIDALNEVGVQVERQTELVQFEDTDSRVLASLRLPDGTSETCETAYIAGCDGAHSVVRTTLGITFPGAAYADLFYVADVQGTGPVMNSEAHVGLDKTEFLAVFPLKGGGRARLVGAVRAGGDTRAEEPTWNDVSKRVIKWMRIDVERVNWFSTYRVHHRVADHFGKGRAFLLGDAAHIHSPVGGQGMNTGIGDAVNLAWKLASVLQGRANAGLLDTFEQERIIFARRLVATTDRAFTGVTSPSAISRFMRLDILPLLLPVLLRFGTLRRFVFRTVSQTAVNYRHSSLSAGCTGTVHGGDRLPWVHADVNGPQKDNYAPLNSLDWQVHVYGNATPELHAGCIERRLALHTFPWRPEMSRTGVWRNAAYLVRPDGYIGLTDRTGNAAALLRYLETWNIAPKPE